MCINPHKINKHCVYIHGDIELKNFSDFSLSNVKNLFEQLQTLSFFEGIVIHVSNGNLYKLHRHHLDMKVEDGYPCILDFIYN